MERKPVGHDSAECDLALVPKCSTVYLFPNADSTICLYCLDKAKMMIESVQKSMTDFLEYELLTPETADPVVLRITGQRERGFEDFTASNGVRIVSHWWPAYGSIPAFDDKPPHFPAPRSRILCVWGKHGPKDDSRALEIPLSDWPPVKQAIRELNEYYSPVAKAMGDMKEKDMKEDRYEFDMKEWEYNTEPEPFETTGPAKLIVRRKKPRVKVEWSMRTRVASGDLAPYGEWDHDYYTVQFRVKGWDAKETFEHDSLKNSAGCWTRLDRIEEGSHYRPIYDGKHSLYIGLDARVRWSAPVLLPESVYKELDKICAALEAKANEEKG